LTYIIEHISQNLKITKAHSRKLIAIQEPVCLLPYKDMECNHKVKGKIK